MSEREGKRLRRGWTTGACATAATRAAYTALLTGEFPDPVTIELPKGQRPAFAIATEALGEGFARAGIIKDAGDDPDVTHLALVVSTVREGGTGGGVEFRGGPGGRDGDEARAPDRGWRAGDQPGAAPHDARDGRGGRGRARREGRRGRRDRSARRRPARREDLGTRGSASSAASRSSEPPGWSSRTRARHGSTRSTRESTSRAP